MQGRIQGLELAYNTVQTMLNVLQRKGKVRRQLKDRAYVYRPILSQYVIGTLLHDIDPQLVVTQACADDYFDVGTGLRHDLKHRAPVSIGQCCIGEHYPHRWLNFKHPSSFVAIVR